MNFFIDTIKTERLYLEKLSDNDALFIVELLNTEGWITFIGNRNISNLQDAINYIKTINSKPNYFFWTVKLNNSLTPIGIVSIIKRDYLEHPDIGFAFLPQYAKKGYAFEASSALLSYLTSQNKITYILAETLQNNISSIKLIERLGLRFEKVIEVDNEVLSIYKASAKQITTQNH